MKGIENNLLPSTFGHTRNLLYPMVTIVPACLRILELYGLEIAAKLCMSKHCSYKAVGPTCIPLSPMNIERLNGPKLTCSKE